MEKVISDFEVYLTQEEKNSITIEKYVRDVRRFSKFAGHHDITKEIVIEYKKSLIEDGLVKECSCFCDLQEHSLVIILQY